MIMKNIVFAVLLSFFSASLFAQGANIPNSLSELLNTDFFTQYEEIRERAHTSVKAFKKLSEEENYSAEDVEIVRDAYTASAEKFNEILLNVKNDLLSKRGRKMLLKFPDAYSSNLEKQLDFANEYYEQTFRKEIARVTNGEVLGMPFLELLPVILKGMKIAIQVIKKFQAEVRKYNDVMLQEHLVEKYKFDDWSKLI